MTEINGNRLRSEDERETPSRPMDPSVANTLRDSPMFTTVGIGGDAMHRAYKRNTRGRDFVVGDIHGSFPAVTGMMEAVDFDAERDRLFHVGDLIDRGPKSEQALAWLRKPWFHSIRGNHDQMLLDASQDPGFCMDLWRMNDGTWFWQQVDQATLLQKFASAFAALPLTTDIDTDGGVVGMIHAEVPEDRTWEELKQELHKGNREDAAMAVWNRARVYRVQEGLTLRDVPGVDRILSGHSCTAAATRIGNCLLIDTGRPRAQESYTKLTMVQIQPGPWRVFELLPWANGHRVSVRPNPFNE